MSSISVSFGDVRQKQIITPNHFISHMIEHIAWRTGLSINLRWHNDNWHELGVALAGEISKFPIRSKQSAALGMIDDGSATISLCLEKEGVLINTTAGIDRDWFIGLRCEQVSSGKPLVELLEGFAKGLHARIEVTIWSVEDPHHTWEGIYRGLGIALSRLITPATEKITTKPSSGSCDNTSLQPGDNKLVVQYANAHQASVFRGTAETGISVAVDLLNPELQSFNIEVDKSISDLVCEFPKLLKHFSTAFNAGISINFKALAFSSSHVVMEDIGLVLGRCLLEILKVRMELSGVNGAGSNIRKAEDIIDNLVQVGVSVEGRKFWRFISKGGDYKKLKESLLIGQAIYNALRSEDLDDFIDGLSGGMSASIMIHIRDSCLSTLGIEQTWTMIFNALGQALDEVFEENSYRRGVPPGVKATLL